jgi:hypothetical protein
MAMAPYDYTDAPPPQERELIPAGTIATLRMHIRPGDCGEDGMLKRSKTGDCEMLDIEYLVIDGPYEKRKFWENLVLDGTTDGHREAEKISRGKLRQIIESAFDIKPSDVSQQARAARSKDLKDFEGMTFTAKIGIEKGGPKKDGNGNWPDKNIIAGVITPDKREWRRVEQPPPFNGGGAAAGTSAPSTSSTSAPSTPALPVARPNWAKG